jgi:hypothetical protein
MDSVACGFDDMTMIGFDGFPQNRIMFCERNLHGFGMFFPKLG